MPQVPSLPAVTAFYGGLNGILFVCLSVAVIVSRLRKKQSIIGPRYALLREQRAHANSAEYLPTFLVLLGLLELVGGGIVYLHIAGLFFTLGRVTHAAGMYASHDQMLETGAPPPWNPFRSFGAAMTLVALAITTGYLLLQSVTRWDDL